MSSEGEASSQCYADKEGAGGRGREGSVKWGEGVRARSSSFGHTTSNVSLGQRTARHGLRFHFFFTQGLEREGMKEGREGRKGEKRRQRRGRTHATMKVEMPAPRS